MIFRSHYYRLKSHAHTWRGIKDIDGFLSVHNDICYVMYFNQLYIPAIVLGKGLDEILMSDVVKNFRPCGLRELWFVWVSVSINANAVMSFNTLKNEKIFRVFINQLKKKEKHNTNKLIIKKFYYSLYLDSVLKKDFVV